MKKSAYFFFLLLLICSFLANCSSKTSNLSSRKDSKDSVEESSPDENSGTLKLEYVDGYGKNFSDDMEVNFGTYNRNTSGSNYINHSFCLSNSYMSGSFVNKNPRDGNNPSKYEVCFNFNDKPGTDRDSLATPGAYPPARSDSVLPPTGSLVGAVIKYTTPDSRGDASFDWKKIQGAVKITEATKEFIDGEINLNDGENSIKGKFHIIPR